MARTPVTFSLRDFFDSFDKRTEGKSGIGNREHKLILETTGEVMKEVLLKEGSLKLFARLGAMWIRKVKPKGDKKAPIDFSNYVAGQPNRYHFNDHSDGYIARILWHRKDCVLNDKHMWLFRPVRNFRRELTHIMKNNLREYTILTK